ncbi:MAG: AMP-binding protein [Acidimicrobiia bacterium]|nr:AMP-binding protein [Acidimicrobiia bacterium]
MEMHFATVWESIADVIPDHAAVVQGARRVSWREYDERAARLAAAMVAAGLGPDAKIGLYLYNCPEYCEANYAGMKLRGVPVNVNYRYLDDELRYLLDNADAEAVVYHTSLADRIARVRAQLPKLKLLVEVDDGPGHVDGAVAYEDLLAAHEPMARIPRGEHDVHIVYTGGTTGMPKGTMYEIGPFTANYLAIAPPLLGLPAITDPADAAPLAAQLVAEGRGLVALPACPLMHATGLWVGLLIPHLLGSTVVLAESRSLDVAELLETVEREGVTELVIVGDSVARPVLHGLEDARAAGRAYALSRLTLVVSTGAMFSKEVKQGLFEHLPHLFVIDILGATEGTMAMQFFTKDLLSDTASFNLGAGVRVFADDGRPVEPGSGVIGMVATTGSIPVGYYKDPEKSARTFREIDGVRYSFPGDYATVEADGSITLLGRGSNVINTGGEKVFPEEVEEALKTHPAVFDALVFGVPDERFGTRISAVVSPGRSTAAPSAEELISHVKTRLAGFKAPRDVHVVETVPRAPNGKADYPSAKALAAGEAAPG